MVGGDEWHGGNLSYHLKSRPKWDNILENENHTFDKSKDGFYFTIGNKDILKKICPQNFYIGNFFKIEKKEICMSW